MRSRKTIVDTVGVRLATPLKVRVGAELACAWEVELAGGGQRASCETLEDATRVAYLCVARTCLPELIVPDA
jgi:hypothetical protein